MGLFSTSYRPSQWQSATKPLAHAPPRPGAHPQHGGKARQGQKGGEASRDSLNFRPGGPECAALCTDASIRRPSTIYQRGAISARTRARHRHRRALNRHGCCRGWTAEVRQPCRTARPQSRRHGEVMGAMASRIVWECRAAQCWSFGSGCCWTG